MKPKVPKTAVPLPPTRLVLRGLTCPLRTNLTGLKSTFYRNFTFCTKKKKTINKNGSPYLIKTQSGLNYFIPHVCECAFGSL